MLIHVENLSKTFKIAERGNSAKDVLLYFFKRKYKEIHAIQDVSFDINEGEIVRIHSVRIGARKIHNN